MAAETQHHEFTTDRTTTTVSELIEDERLRTALLVGAYGVAHAVALLVAVSITVTLAGVLPGGAVALVGTIVGGLGLIAAAPVLVRRAFAAALDARESDAPR